MLKTSSITPVTIFSELSLVFELLQIDETKFPKSFKPRSLIQNSIHPLNFVCPICKIENTSGKSTTKDNIDKIESHIKKCHVGFYDYKTKLSYEKTLAYFKLLKSILFLGMIS